MTQKAEQAGMSSPELATCVATLSSAEGSSQSAAMSAAAPMHSWLTSVPCTDTLWWAPLNNALHLEHDDHMLAIVLLWTRRLAQ